MTPTAIPILRSVFAAYAFFLAHWRPILIAGLPYTVAYALYLFLTQGLVTGTLDPGFQPLVMLVSIASIIASIALSAAALRMAVRGDFSGWMGLQLGRDEFRVFIVSLLVALLTAIVFVLVFLFWGTVFGTVAGMALERAGLDPEETGFDLMEAVSYMGRADWVAVIALGLGAMAIVVWLTGRLVLSLPATIDQRAIRVMKVWPLSDRNGWRIVLCLLPAGLPILIELGLYEAISGLLGQRILDVAHLLGEENATAPGMMRMREYSLWLGLFSAINVPVFSGLYAYIYQNRMKALSPQ
ncbi:hypothetical protein [Maricaulis parjimensis]|uniref:hypothetical protein n=1 Tax=Maricaulis parjimensis TaxID=144023 RepID=UPI001939C073|nr:hypothetical protein [Maricaulis parjimensis]